MVVGERHGVTLGEYKRLQETILGVVVGAKAGDLAGKLDLLLLRHLVARVFTFLCAEGAGVNAGNQSIEMLHFI